MTDFRDAKTNYDPKGADDGDAHRKLASDQTINVSPQTSYAIDSNRFGIGQILAGKYKMLSVLGSGGMGTVYHVQQVFLKIDMALKVLDFKQASNASHLNRFTTEAKAAYTLNHHTLVKVFDFGLLEQEQPYFAMEYIDGITLAQYLKQSGPLSLAMVAPIFSQIAEGLDYAHKHAVIHRDIKPGNIMLVNGTEYGAPGSVRIVDFGIAKTAMQGGIGEIQALTQTGEVFGSPLYMSPEQCSGGAIDYRTDIYSLGCTLFEALTGTPPHVGANQLRTMMLHTTEGAPSLTEASLGREFPSGLNELVQKMLAKSPEDRYQNLWTMSKQLNDINLNKNATAEKNSQNRKSGASPFVFSHAKLWIWLASALTLVVICYSFGRNFLVVKDKDEKQNSSRVTQNIDAADETADPFGAAQGAMENAHLLRLKQSQQAFAVAGPVVSEIVGEGPTRQRKIVFPDYSIGRVFVIKQNRSLGKEYFEAKGTQYMPAEGELHIQIGGSYTEAFFSPSIYEVISPNMFSRLILCGPAWNLELKNPPTAEDKANKAASILTITSKWNSLTDIYLERINLNADSLSAIGNMKNLRIIELRSCTGITPKASQLVFLKKVEAITLTDSNTFNAILSLADFKSLIALGFVHSKVKPKDLDDLKSCSKLSILKIDESKFDMDFIPRIAKITSLNTFSFGKSTITSKQVATFLKGCPKVKTVMVSRRNSFDFQDPRIRFNDE